MNLNDELKHLKELHYAELAQYLIQQREIFFSDCSSSGELNLVTILKAAARNGKEGFNIKYHTDYDTESWVVGQQTYDVTSQKYTEPLKILKEPFFNNLKIFLDSNKLKCYIHETERKVINYSISW